MSATLARMTSFGRVFLAATIVGLLTGTSTFTQGRVATAPSTPMLVKPARVFDGDAMHEGWAVLIRGAQIESIGPVATLNAASATTIDLPGTTLLPGLIEAHSHFLLHPYNETSWNDQVTHELLALRIARATTALKATLDAGLRRFAISVPKEPVTRTSG